MKKAFTFTLIVVLALINIQQTWAQSRQADSLALVALYNATSGANWRTTWDLTQSMSTWNGVTLSNNRVRRVSLTNQRLAGTIPNLNLTNLEDLILQDNRLIGSIPDFSNLGNLEELNLDDNQLTGTIPDFSNLDNLKGLRLQENQLTGVIPDFSNLPLLEQLWLSNNQLSGTLPNFSNLPKISIIWCFRSQLSGTIPNFTNTPLLRILYLANNQLNGTIPNFSDLNNLEWLYLSNNQLSGAIPDFSNLSKLEALELNDNQLSGTIPNFSNLPKTTRIWCNRNQLTGIIPDFSSLPLLEQLWLSSNQLTGTVPNFSSLNNLEWLQLSNNQLSGTIPDFTSINNLEKLYLHSNQLSGTIPNFSNLRNLDALDLKNNQLTGTIPNLSNVPFLTLFDISTNQFTFEDILPNYNRLPLSVFRYHSQSKIGTTQVVGVPAGSTYTIDLVIDDTVSTNIYYWYKNFQIIDTIYGVNEYTITNFQAGDQGRYYVDIINSIATNPSTTGQNLIIRSETITLNLICNPTSSTITEASCGPYISPSGIVYTMSGVYMDTIQNIAGCDSVVTINLTINNSSIGTDVQMACDSFTWMDGNTYIASNNTATFTLTNATGCDSIITLDLTINSPTICTPQICLSTTNITSTATPNGAIISWDTVANAMQYELRYREVGTSALSY
ncbi:MAG: hypothetical protein ACRBFS_21425, partial [Aureispira sp.]